LPTQAPAFLAVFVYATHATQAIVFEWNILFSLWLLLSINDDDDDDEWKPGFSHFDVRQSTVVS